MKQNIETLKEYFETGDRPSQQNYADLIDSLGMPMIGEIKATSFCFAPGGWAKCNGELLAPTDYPELFALIGTTFGGDGINNFALPDLCGRIPLGYGSATGLSTYTIGQTGGEESHILTEDEMPSHNHVVTLSGVSASLDISSENGTTNDPNGNYLAKGVTPAAGPVPAGVANIYSTTSNNSASINLNGTPTINNSGLDLPHNIIQPYLAINYIIAVEGINPL